MVIKTAKNTTKNAIPWHMATIGFGQCLDFLGFVVLNTAKKWRITANPLGNYSMGS